MSLFDRLADMVTGRTARGEGPDRDMQRVLDALAALGAKPLEDLTPTEARGQPTPADAVTSLLREGGKDPMDDLGVATRDFNVSGAAGPIPARLYRPKDAGDKTLPTVAYWHGGGWVIADLDVYDATPRAIARNAHCNVVSFHYRQAPEYKFPAAHEDALACYRWLLERSLDLQGDPARIAVMGESAGGNLAANVSIAARDDDLPPPVHQVLVYPVAGADMTTESYIENANAKPLGKAAMEWFVGHVFADKAEAQNPRIDLVNANLAGLPATTIVLAQIDPLRSEGEKLAEELEAAGVAVKTRLYTGVTHEFFGMGLVVHDAREAEGFVARELKSAFGTSALPM